MNGKIDSLMSFNQLVSDGASVFDNADNYIQLRNIRKRHRP